MLLTNYTHLHNRHSLLPALLRLVTKQQVHARHNHVATATATTGRTSRILYNKQVTTTVRHNHHHHVCVIGSGPAGFYAAQHLLKLRAASTTPVHVDLFEKLPVPFGLVRYGVAPDHPEVKNVTNTFNNVLRNQNVRFVGNVEAGKDFSFQQLKQHYHAIVLCHGATSDRLLNIPNEDLITSARDFVGWYNGLPQNSHLPVNLSQCTRAVVIGHGNVALDIARLLLTDPSTLEYTDIADYALEQLRSSRIREVVIVGRRGLLQVSFTIKEFREMVKLDNVSWDIQVEGSGSGGESVVDPQVLQTLNRPRKRLTELILKSASEGVPPPPHSSTLSSSQSNDSHHRHWTLKFLRSPVSVTRRPTDNRLVVKFAVNKLEDDKAVPTCVTEEIVCDMAFRSIGYKGKRLFSELPFDEATGVIPNKNGRIMPGIYCSGWAGAGPRGVILSTMQHAFEVAKMVSSDLDATHSGPPAATTGEIKHGFEGMTESGVLENVNVTSYDDYLKIAAWEQENGRKITDVAEMIRVCGKGTS